MKLHPTHGPLSVRPPDLEADDRRLDAVLARLPRSGDGPSLSESVLRLYVSGRLGPNLRAWIEAQLVGSFRARAQLYRLTGVTG